jgi:hypothetical protein
MTTGCCVRGEGRKRNHVATGQRETFLKMAGKSKFANDDWLILNGCVRGGDYAASAGVQRDTRPKMAGKRYLYFWREEVL